MLKSLLRPRFFSCKSDSAAAGRSPERRPFNNMNMIEFLQLYIFRSIISIIIDLYVKNVCEIYELYHHLHL
ncbi:hypothetical protein DQX05_18885 [Paenibacillus thiaminolyticus]|uniref:Uncharacterized protein n=1 Tax=Paenibacillus thiaminolyticus TaxID=49283 RepID=A0A3A3GF67_PANTH|nr:hypothetical protein DQX05_18885 [Paenibacillus thiaminolyticus]